MSAQPEVWVVRHGETEWSRSGQHTGRTDVELTPGGEAVAREMAPRLQEQAFDRVLSSPLQRARRTAELAGLTDIEIDPDLLEWDYGAYEGRRTLDIRGEVPNWSIWTHHEEAGESLAQVAARADAVIARIRTGDDDKVAVFSHSHYLRVFAARWIDLPPEAGQHLVLDTSAYGILGWYRETPVVRRWNA